MILREVLHAHIPTLTAESTFRDAVDKMDVYQFPALVVVDGDMAPTHVVTEGDLVRGVQLRGQLVGLSSEKIAVFASPDPFCLGPGVEISEALHHMLDRGLSVLPVVEEGRLIGMCLRVDLMQAMLMDAATSAQG